MSSGQTEGDEGALFEGARESELFCVLALSSQFTACDCRCIQHGATQFRTYRITRSWAVVREAIAVGVYLCKIRYYSGTLDWPRRVGVLTADPFKR